MRVLGASTSDMVASRGKRVPENPHLYTTTRDLFPISQILVNECHWTYHQ